MSENKRTVQEYMDAFTVTDHVGSVLDPAFCDVFEMRDGKIERLTTYVVELPG